ncbi:mycofactocin biosynthesis glycosyltransferase MftF [Microbacterium sp. A93]|uniref:mycofactocin biosynthesis glycosyltransferase MftF n=1 Tax=Microbacterium sp. A93 TaxID=3450716 RepID=UPI003F433E8D
MISTPILRTQGSYTRRSGELLFGGSPWGLARLSAPARPWAHRVLRAGARAVAPGTDVERATARLLVDRGLALPVLPARAPRPEEIEVVVPVYGSAEPLARLLAALGAADPDGEVGGGSRVPRVTVVDDGSAETDAREIARVCAEHGVRLVVLPQNLGPGGARNAGLAATTAGLVAFLDADTLPSRGWLEHLVPHFDDPAVAAAAPRVRGAVTGPGTGSLLERFEMLRGGLDLGPHARRVAPGGQVGYVPTAALVVRRVALPDPAFEPGLRVGEDVDLVWRLVEAGWSIRYLPAAEVHHEVRSGVPAWARRHAAYGSSAVPLERRHPGRLAPATLGWPGLTLLLGAVVAAGGGARGSSGARAVGAGMAAVGIAVQIGASVRRLRGRGLPVSAGVEIAVLGLRSEATAIGHALRREWWPIGAAALLLTTASVPRVRAVARAVVVLGMLPTVPDTAHAARHHWQFLRGPTPRMHDAGAPLDPVRHLVLRLGADAAYGTGVIGAAVRSGCLSVLRPRFRGRVRG